MATFPTLGTIRPTTTTSTPTPTEPVSTSQAATTSEQTTTTVDPVPAQLDAISADLTSIRTDLAALDADTATTADVTDLATRIATVATDLAAVTDQVAANLAATASHVNDATQAAEQANTAALTATGKADRGSSQRRPGPDSSSPSANSRRPGTSESRQRHPSRRHPRGHRNPNPGNVGRWETDLAALIHPHRHHRANHHHRHDTHHRNRRLSRLHCRHRPPVVLHQPNPVALLRRHPTTPRPHRPRRSPNLRIRGNPLQRRRRRLLHQALSDHATPRPVQHSIAETCVLDVRRAALPIGRVAVSLHRHNRAGHPVRPTVALYWLIVSAFVATIGWFMLFVATPPPTP